MSKLVQGIVFCLLLTASLSAETLSLSQAVAITLEKNPLRKAAAADVTAAGAGVREARASFLPKLTFSEAAARGNDPVYVFGSKLRQQRFTTVDFALNRLNTPTPLNNFTTRLGGQWNLFDSLQSWMGVSRAQTMKQAAGQQLQRTDQELILRTVQAYFGLLLAVKQQQVAEQSVHTAQSVSERSKARFDAGLVVEADYLSAQVNLASRQQELIRARNAVALARAQLNNALGVPMSTPFEPAEALAERPLVVGSLEDLEKKALDRRPDLKRMQSEEAAQATSARMAKAAFGPRLNVFAQVEADNPKLFAGGGGNNWLGGVELQLDLFQGGAKLARVAREKALQERVSAMRQAAADNVRLEVRSAYYDVDAARQQVEVARAAIAQAEESLRINQNRYESGLTTITDLLRVEEATRRARTDYWDAVYRFRTSFAALELATGTLSQNSAVVTP